MSRFLILLLFCCACTQAQIYKTVDGDGNVVFTDKPPPNAGATEAVKLNTTNSVPPPPSIPKPSPKKSAIDPTDAISVQISSPANETTIAMGPGNFSVSASSSAWGQLQLQIDGNNWGDPQTDTSWALTHIIRGAHDLTVLLVDKNGKELARSEPVRVYVLRPSKNFR